MSTPAAVENLTPWDVTCPDCGADVFAYETTHYTWGRVARTHALAERCEDGEWSAVDWTDRVSHLPMMLRGGGYCDAIEGRFTPHVCPRRVTTKESLSTLADLYGSRKRGPKMTIPASEFKVGIPEKGELVTVVNGRREVRAEVVETRVTVRIVDFEGAA